MLGSLPSVTRFGMAASNFNCQSFFEVLSSPRAGAGNDVPNAIIAILSTLLMPVALSMRKKALVADCANNLRQIGMAAQSYADERRCFPWCKPGDAVLAEEAEALACLELLYKYNYVDDTAVFLCKAAALDREAERIRDLKERQRDFRLEPEHCSFTWRNRV